MCDARLDDDEVRDTTGEGVAGFLLNMLCVCGGE